MQCKWCARVPKNKTTEKVRERKRVHATPHSFRNSSAPSPTVKHNHTFYEIYRSRVNLSLFPQHMCSLSQISSKRNPKATVQARAAPRQERVSKITSAHWTIVYTRVLGISESLSRIDSVELLIRLKRFNDRFKVVLY